ncbi:MAG: DUF599 family protein, partial [Hydrogenophaga sp.]|nr:DUF599 family protein [Hydrogenophaga sp.]
MTLLDYFALCLFGLLWFAFAWITGQGRIFARTSLTQAMAERRRLWIMNSLGRDLKMIDTQILSGLQNGTAFFASTSILAIGGCFALLGQTEQVDTVLKDLPFVMPGGRTTFELKVFVLTAIFGYSFFKFGWSYRLFNYCTILFGALPMADEARRDPEAGGARRRTDHPHEHHRRQPLQCGAARAVHVDRLSRLVRQPLPVHGNFGHRLHRPPAPAVLLRSALGADRIAAVLAMKRSR